MLFGVGRVKVIPISVSEDFCTGANAEKCSGYGEEHSEVSAADTQRLYLLGAVESQALG